MARLGFKSGHVEGRLRSTKSVSTMLAILAVALVAIAGFLLSTLLGTLPQVSNTSVSRAAVAVPKNEMILFPVGIYNGVHFSFALWNLTIRNNSQQTQYLTAILSSSAGYPDFVSVTLNASQTVQQLKCEGPVPSGRNYTLTLASASASGPLNFSVPATIKAATQIPFTGQATAVNTLENQSSQGFPEYREWNLTLKNTGTNPIIFVHATLYDTDASQPIFQLSSCPDYFVGGQGSEQVHLGSPQNPLLPGFSVTLTSPSFPFEVTSGKTYHVEYVLGYSTTEVRFTTTVVSD